jgi:hypothetical protein
MLEFQSWLALAEAMASIPAQFLKWMIALV